MQTLVRLGETERAEQALAALGDQDRDRGEMRIGLAVLRLAQDDPHAAIAALAPVLDGSAPVPWPGWLAQAFLLEAIARDALGDPAAAGRALERALDLAEPDGALSVVPAAPGAGPAASATPGTRTAHAALIADILSLLAGRTLAPPPAGPRPPLEPLSDSEIRVLRYLPTNLSGPEIAGELYVSHNTVRTHMRHLYAKLGTHRRAEAVARARALGLLAPSPLPGPGHASWLTAGQAGLGGGFPGPHAGFGELASQAGRRRVCAGQVLAPDPHHEQRDDHGQRPGCPPRPGSPGRTRWPARGGRSGPAARPPGPRTGARRLGRAVAAAAWERRLLATALQATVPRIASPIAPPTCCPTLTRLEATPVSSLFTLVSPTRLMGTNSGPGPGSGSPPSIPPTKVLCSVSRDSQNIPDAEITLPAISSGRAPIRLSACCAIAVVARTAGTNGR